MKGVGRSRAERGFRAGQLIVLGIILATLPLTGRAQAHGHGGSGGAAGAPQMAAPRMPEMPRGGQIPSIRPPSAPPTPPVPRMAPPPRPAAPSSGGPPVRRGPLPYARPPIRMQEPLPSSPMAPPRTPTPAQSRALTPQLLGRSPAGTASGVFIPAFGGSTSSPQPAVQGGRGVDTSLFPFFRLRRHPVVFVGPELFFFSPAFFCDPFLFGFGFVGSSCFISPFSCNAFFFDPFFSDWLFFNSMSGFWGMGAPWVGWWPTWSGAPWLWGSSWPGFWWGNALTMSPLQTSVMISNGVLPGLSVPVAAPDTSTDPASEDRSADSSEAGTPDAASEEAAVETGADPVRDAQPGEPVTLVFSDGNTARVVRYWLDDSWMVHYELLDGEKRTIPLDRLDLLATMSTNLRQGLRFLLPAVPQPH